jgi:hypothetical protein
MLPQEQFDNLCSTAFTPSFKISSVSSQLYSAFLEHMVVGNVSLFGIRITILSLVLQLRCASWSGNCWEDGAVVRTSGRPVQKLEARTEGRQSFHSSSSSDWQAVSFFGYEAWVRCWLTPWVMGLRRCSTACQAAIRNGSYDHRQWPDRSNRSINR